MRARIELENGEIFTIEGAKYSIKLDPLHINEDEFKLQGHIESDITSRLICEMYKSSCGGRGQFSCKPQIEKVIFNEPATIVLWSDNTKTVVKCQEGDTYSKELGLAMCIVKKYLGNQSNFNNEFKKWIPKEIESLPSVAKMRAYIKKYCGRTSCQYCVINNLPQHIFCHCYRKGISDEEIIMNYKAIKESERHAK